MKPILHQKVRVNFLTLVITILSLCADAQNETIKTGSFIINMGNTNTLSINDDVRPYGMIYDLMKNYNVPVKWVIAQGKVKDGADFVHNGITYKGGTFIIPADYRSATVNGRITFWQGQGVVGATSVSDFSAYVYKTLISVPRWTLDAANGAIAQAYLTAAGITLTAFPGAYNWKSPQALDCCDDFFVMPHANPTWDTHSRLWSWNKDCLGSIWAACHAVSALENSINPANSTQQMNFLSTRTAAVLPTPWVNNSLKLWGTHSGGSLPYTHRLFDNPVAQYMGVTDLSQLNGSEQIYIPKQSIDPGGATRWRPGVNIIAYDPTQNTNVPNPDLPNGNVAALIVYGRGMDDPARGFVMYEAGHSHLKGTTSDGPALRAFLNFSFFQVQPKAPQLGTVSGLTGGQTITQASPLSLSITASSPLTGITFTYQWVSSVAGGLFSPSNTASTTYTPPAVVSNTPCTITCIVTDNCGRKSFQSVPVTIVPPPRPPVPTADAASIDPSCGSITITKNVLANDSDPDGDPLTLTQINGNTGSFTTANGGLVSFTSAGVINYTSAAGFIGNDILTYKVCDNTTPTALCTDGTYTITIGNIANIPATDNESVTIAEDNIAANIDVLTGDVANAPGGLTVSAITSSPANGKVSINPDNTITYVPNQDFAGTDNFTYKIVNSLGYTKTGIVTVNVTNDACDGGTYAIQPVIEPTLTLFPTADTYIDEANPGTNNGSALTIDLNRQPGNRRRTIMNFNVSSIPASAKVAYARLYLNQSTSKTDVAAVYRINANWTETGATWTNMNANFDGTTAYPTGGIIPASGWNMWDVTSLVQSWVNGTFTNQGLMIKVLTESGGAAIHNYNSNNAASLKPYLEIVYSNNASSVGSASLPDIADTYIDQNIPASNYGTVNPIQTDRQGGQANRALIKFDLSSLPQNINIFQARVNAYQLTSKSDIIAAYRIPNSWVENTATWTSDNTNFDGVTEFPIGGIIPATGWNSWNIGNLAQQWYNNTYSNNGVMLKVINESGGGSTATWVSREETITPANRPFLNVTYFTGACLTIPARAPLGNQDTASTLSTTPVTFNVLNNDHLFSAAATALTISTAPIAAQGTATANLGAGTITFTPNPTFNGVASFQYTVTTANGSDVVRVYVRVNNSPVNAVDDNPAGQNSGTTQTIIVLSNDVDPEGAALTVTILTQPTNGTAIVNGSNQVVYTPNTGFTGTDALTYRVCEPSPTCGSPYCDDAVLNLIVLNQPPVGTPDSKTVLPCLANTINLLSNDTDPEGQVLTISNLSALSNIAAGTLVNNNDGTVTFTPTPGYSGTVTFTYSITDNGVPPMTSLTPATVTIIVFNPPNTAPIALNDVESTNMEEVLYASILDNDSDPENQELTIPVITVAPLHGTATVLANGLIEYTPNPGFSGTDVLTYQICDKVINQAICSTAPGFCVTATLTITVEAPNTVIAINDENSTWVNTPVSGATLTNDVDPQGDLPLVFGGFIIGGTSYTSGTHIISGTDASGAPVANAGTLTINADGTYTFTPANNFTGSINVPYVLNDSNPNVASDTANLRITVNPVPTGTNSVIANNDEISTLPNTTVSSTLFNNDRDPQANSFTVTSYLFDNDGDGIADQSGTIGAPIIVGGITTAGTPVANAGTLTINADGTYTFIPAADFSGTVEVPYTITDALGATSTAILHIDILPDLNGASNDRPQPGDDFVYTAFNTPENSTFINNDTDPNANPVSLNGTPINTGGPATPIGSPVATAQGGTVQFYANGTYTYTPPVGYTGPDRVVYQVCDITAVNPQPLCADATIHMLVAPSLITLPATGLKATASLQGVIATIKWETLSEQNTDYFILERSLDNSSFTPIGSAVVAAGNSVSKQVYQQGDDISSLVQQSIIYYRVRLADIDGKMKYSNVVAVRMNKTIGITAWPNPFTSSITVNISSGQNTELIIRVTDMAGRVIRTNNQQVPRGISQVLFNNLDQIANGIYLLDVIDKNSGNHTVYKLIKEQ